MDVFRQARVNTPGLLYHVMARGIERRAIFLKAEDYEDFIARLELGLSVVPGQVLGWSLMPNRFHLLAPAGGNRKSVERNGEIDEKVRRRSRQAPRPSGGVMGIEEAEGEAIS